MLGADYIDNYVDAMSLDNFSLDLILHFVLTIDLTCLFIR